MMDVKIGFIGAGNMASSLIGGLIANGVDSSQLWASATEKAHINSLQQRFAINVSLANTEVAENVDVLILAVKPPVVPVVIKQLQTRIKQRKLLVISVAAGVRAKTIAQIIDGDVAVVRCMPNTPSLLQSGASGLYANQYVSTQQKELAETLLRAVGVTVWVENENQLDIVTALSGSGPAYYFYIMEAMIARAVKLGLPEKTAQLLAVETALGAARMALESNDSPGILREQVTSPGGTTAAALQILADNQVDETFAKALDAAYQRAGELANLFDQNS